MGFNPAGGGQTLPSALHLSGNQEPLIGHHLLLLLSGRNPEVHPHLRRLCDALVSELETVYTLGV